MAGSKLSKYEEIRLQRIEENKKRMEELNLTTLARSLKPHTPSPAKRRIRTPKVSSDQVRRSSRVANKPAPNYKDDIVVPSLSRKRSYPRRNLLSGIYASDEERLYAIQRAEKIEAGLDSQYPSFVKAMLQSHVSGCFWLGLPVQFCKDHLPKEDETIMLIDEEGNESPTKYLPRKTGLSGGWRGFSLDHGLVDGDAVVFHLVNPTTFQVYIVRANESEDDEDKVEDEEQIAENKTSDARRSTRIAKRAKSK